MFERIVRVKTSNLRIDGLAKTGPSGPLVFQQVTRLRRPRDFAGEGKVLCAADCWSVETGRSESARDGKCSAAPDDIDAAIGNNLHRFAVPSRQIVDPQAADMPAQ